MSSIPSMLWRVSALIFTILALAACGSSSAGSSPGSASASTKGSSDPSPTQVAEPEEAGGMEAELEGIMRLKIYGKFGGTSNEFDIPGGGSCGIVKINTSPAEVKSGGAAVLDHEGNASVLVKAKGGDGGAATTKECREAVEYAIG